MLRVIGLGPGGLSYLSKDAYDAIQTAERRFVRTKYHPVIDELPFVFESFDDLYDQADSFEHLYHQIAEILIELSRTQNIVYCVPGSPYIAEKSVQKLIERIDPEVIAGVSFLEPVMKALKLDPTDGLLIHDALSDFRIEASLSMLLLQIYSKDVASDVKLRLMEKIEPERPVTIVRWAGIAGKEELIHLPLFEMDRYEGYDHLTTLYVPAGDKDLSDIDSLLKVARRLRAPGGCPWDGEQTHESLRRYLLEEAYEVIEAIDNGHFDELEDELGDLLYQVVFHSLIAEEEGYFDFSEVIKTITEKLIRRHTHVFKQDIAENSEEVLKLWEQNKAGEKSFEERLESIPRSSVLHRLQKIMKLLKKYQKPIPQELEIAPMVRELIILADRAEQEDISLDFETSSVVEKLVKSLLQG